MPPFAVLLAAALVFWFRVASIVVLAAPIWVPLAFVLVYLLGGAATGWSAEQVAEALQVDANTVRNHFKRYREGGVKALGHAAYQGSESMLDEEQLAILDAHLQTHLYETAKAIAH